MKATNQQIKEIIAQLIRGIPVARKIRNRELMTETVLRIRQLRGILEARG